MAGVGGGWSASGGLRAGSQGPNGPGSGYASSVQVEQGEMGTRGSGVKGTAVLQPTDGAKRPEQDPGTGIFFRRKNAFG